MGNTSLQVVDSGRPTHWRQAPVTALFALASILVFLFFYVGAPPQWISYLTFLPFDIVQRQLVFGEMDGQLWRLVTPAFLHFGWLHITFNCLWLWEFGGRIERVLGSGNMLGLLLVVAAVSNVSQHWYSGPVLFGGMSGVVYGLLGFSWVAPMVQPRWPLRPAPAIIAFMVGWLLLCMTGVMGILGAGAVANAAHVGGLVCGGLLGLVFAMLSRLQDRRPRG